jgi:FtsZ-binding cell division protein ZapB
MDQVALIDQSREYLLNAATQLQDEIDNLKKFRDDLITQSNALHREHNNLKDELQSWTRTSLAADDITVEQAQALASIANFKLTRNYDVTILVEHSFSVELEADDEIDDVLGSMDFSANSYHTTLENEDYSVVETNYDESDFS